MHSTEVLSKGWWDIKRQRLQQAIAQMKSKERITVFQPFAVIDNDMPGLDVRFANESSLLDDPNATVDISFNQGYKHNIPPLWEATKTARAGVTACWFWDNHHLFETTMHAAMLADVSFAAHNYASHYLDNELGRYGGFIPLCPIFWTPTVVNAVMKEVEGAPRRLELYGGYNSYIEFPERNAFLSACQDAIPTNVLKIRPPQTPLAPDDYFYLPPEDKLRDNCEYKVALCVSFGHNTTNRTFDALLSGQIPIVVGEIWDLDSIISPADQERLPLLRVRSANAVDVRDAYMAALERFDADGEEGIRRRSEFVLRDHMPRNRIMKMVEAIVNLDI